MGNISWTTFTSTILNINAAVSTPTSITAAQGALFSSNTSGSNTQPLWIKNNASLTLGWVQEAAHQIHNQTVTSVAPFFISLANITATISNIVVTVGTPVGIYGPAAWTVASGNLNISRNGHGSAGSQNATIISGGVPNVGLGISNTELFNGSSWINTANMNTSRYLHFLDGSQNASIATGGQQPSVMSSTETFNGSTWIVSSNLNTSRESHAGAGSQNATIVSGGNNSASLASYETFNGSSWTIGPGNLVLINTGLAGSGAQNAAWVAGGASNNLLSTTETFNGSAWLIAGNINTARESHAGVGSQNAGLINGGTTNASTFMTSTELFNGSVWSFSGNTTYSKYQTVGSGSQNAAIVNGGNANGGSFNLNICEFHNQITYAPLNYQSYKTAKNIGILSLTSSSSTASVAFSGYVNYANITVSSNNLAITQASQMIGTFNVLAPNSSSTLTGTGSAGNANMTDGVIQKSITNITADDMLISYNLSATEIQVFNNLLAGLSPANRW